MRFGFAALVRGFFIAAILMTASAARAATYMYVGNAANNEIFVFALDPKTGALTKLKQYPMGKNPNWIKIVNLP